MRYPNGKTTNSISYKSRGASLEKDLNLTNKYYADKGIAFIYKKPTPIKLVKVDYPSKNNIVSKIIIKEAYFEMPSTTDYNGLYKGKYIDFEAKETASKTSFPISNIHKHQLNHLRNIINNGGIGFIIVRFTSLNKTFILMGKDLFNYLDNSLKKSIPYDYFLKQGHLIKEGYLPRLDYLEIIKNIMEE